MYILLPLTEACIFIASNRVTKLNLPFSLFSYKNVGGKGKHFRTKVIKKYIRNYIRKIKTSDFIGVYIVANNSASCSAVPSSLVIFLNNLCLVVEIVDTALLVKIEILEEPKPNLTNIQTWYSCSDNLQQEYRWSLK